MTDDAGITHALAKLYASWGWRVIPVCAGTKVPAVNDWVRVATSDEYTIERWWGLEHPSAGIGIVTGHESDLCVIDVDDKPGKFGSDTLESYCEEHGRLPDTPTVLTPTGGRHLYFRWPGFNPAQSALGEWVDVQGEGRFVVAPPSVHPNGGTYAWEHSLRPSQTPLAELNGFIAAPSASSRSCTERDPLFAEVFEAADWTLARVDNKGQAHWTRPGKSPREGSSATEYPYPDAHVTVWSTSVPGVPIGEPLGPSRMAELLAGGLANITYLQPQIAARRIDERPGSRLALVPASSIRIKRQRWLWRHRVPLGGAAILVGQEGLGKSTIAADLCARATRGRLEGDLTEPLGAVYVTAEDSESATIVPRLMAVGADLDRVHFVRIDALPGGLSIPADLDELVAEMKRHRARLLVLDPLSVHLGNEKMDAHRERDVRRAIGPLAFAMEAIDGSALGLMHWSKGPSLNALDRVLGSRAFTAAARAILGVGEDPDEAGQRMLVLAKSNLGRLDVPALTFTIVERLIDDPNGGLPISTSGVEWIGQREGVRSSDLFRIAESAEEQGAMVSACALIVKVLEDGPADAKILDDARRAAAIAEKTFKRARQFLGVVTEQVRDGSGQITGWVVRLP
jgi:hypothetical protein